MAFESKDGEAESAEFVQTQIELLHSPMVLAPIVADRQSTAIPELSREQNPLEWLRRKIEVKPVGMPDLYTVEFACSDPKAAAYVVNAVLESYFSLQTIHRQKSTDTVLAVLNQEMIPRTLDVEHRRKEVRELALQMTGKDPFLTTLEAPSTDVKNLANLFNRLVRSELETGTLTRFKNELTSVNQLKVDTAALTTKQEELERSVNLFTIVASAFIAVSLMYWAYRLKK